MTDLIMLATLLNGPKHGYQLKREAGFIFGQQALHNNLVYPLLRRFASHGWVSRKAVPGERGQTRQQYALTAAGRKVLVQRLGEFSERDAGSQESFIVRVGLFGILSAETRLRILKLRATHLRAREETLSAISQHLALDKQPAEVVRFLIGQIHSESAWIGRLRRDVEKTR